jgi:hypothetical protein
MLLLDRAAAIAAIPALLPQEAEPRSKAFELIDQILRSRGVLPTEGQSRLQQMAMLFVGDQAPTLVPALEAATDGKESKVKIPASAATPERSREQEQGIMFNNLSGARDRVAPAKD